jgi:hypothetical protein
MSRATVIETHEHKREFKEPHFSIRAFDCRMANDPAMMSLAIAARFTTHGAL